MLSDPEADAQQFGGEAESDRRTIEFGVPPPKRLDLAPQRAALVHMDQSMDYAGLVATLPKGVEPGYDGQGISL